MSMHDYARSEYLQSIPAVVVTIIAAVATAVFAGPTVNDPGPGTPMAPQDIVGPLPLARGNLMAAAPVSDLAIPAPPGETVGADFTTLGELKIIDGELISDVERLNIPQVFYWQIPSDNGAEVFNDEHEMSVWARRILSVPAKSGDSAQLHRASPAVAYLELPGRGATVRFVRDPYDKTLKRPAEVQVLVDVAFSPEAIRGLLKQLADHDPDRPLRRVDIARMKEIITSSPLAFRFKTAAWNLESFTYQVRWQTVAVCLTTEIDNELFDLQVAAGPKGSMLVISGSGLNVRSEEQIPSSPPTPADNGSPGRGRRP